MRRIVGNELGVKASGGVRTAEDVAQDGAGRREPDRRVARRSRS